jgi:ureidoacrylate peracid hydrolase
MGVNTLIVTGVVTNICVRSTCHDAFFRGYDVLVPRECVSATSEREQESSLYDIDTHYGAVTSLEQVLVLLARQEVAQ